MVAKGSSLDLEDAQIKVICATLVRLPCMHVFWCRFFVLRLHINCSAGALPHLAQRTDVVQLMSVYWIFCNCSVCGPMQVIIVSYQCAIWAFYCGSVAGKRGNRPTRTLSLICDVSRIHLDYDSLLELSNLDWGCSPLMAMPEGPIWLGAGGRDDCWHGQVPGLGVRPESHSSYNAEQLADYCRPSCYFSRDYEPQLCGGGEPRLEKGSSWSP